MFAVRNLRRNCFKSLSSLLQSNPTKNNVAVGSTKPDLLSSYAISACGKVTSGCSNDTSNPTCGLFRNMSTTRRSMRSKVEKRMQKESGKTLREVRRARAFKKKLMTEEERLLYNLKRAKKKVALLLQKLKKYELPELPTPRHDPELLTPEQLQAYKKIGFKNKNYVPVGVRGVFGGVVQNMHMHWKFHETVQVCCDNFPKEKIKEMAAMLARLSGGIVINIHNVKTIIMFRGRNYRQPKNLIPINTLTKRKALFKARFEQALESQKLNIKKIEQQLRKKGINPEDPTAMASIQRVASTFFNAIDKKEGSPYVFHGLKQSPREQTEGEESKSAESDQEELDRFIADIEHEAEKEFEAEEEKEKEELGRIRYWNRQEFGGRFRRSDARGSDNSDTDQMSNDSDAENNVRSDSEWDSVSNSNVYDSDDENCTIESNGSSRRFRPYREEKKKFPSTTKTKHPKGSDESAGEYFRWDDGQQLESDNTFSDLENSMWGSDTEGESVSRSLGQTNSNNYKSSSDE